MGIFTPEEKAEMKARLLATLKPKPKPSVPTPQQQAVERFNPNNKPTEAVINDATAHNEALEERLRQERELALAEQTRAQRQAQLDRWWQSALDAKAEAYVQIGGFRELRRPTCHRGR